MRLRGWSLLAVVVATAAISPTARAQPSSSETQACLDAAPAGQRLERAGSLRAARVQYQTCSQPTCPREVSDDCVKWQSHIDEIMPTVVVFCEDAAGRDIGSSAHVEIDGHSVDTLKEVELDPGKHDVVMLSDTGTAQVREVVFLRPRDKGHRVALRIHPPPTVPPRAPPIGAYVALATSAVGFGVFGVAGIKGIADRSSFHCDQPAVGCSASNRTTVDTEFWVANISLAVGVVALATSIVLFSLRAAHNNATALQVSGLQFQF